MLTMMTASAGQLRRIAGVLVELRRVSRLRQAAVASLSGLDDWILQDIGASRFSRSRRGRRL